jgi:hypothetical protein
VTSLFDDLWICGALIRGRKAGECEKGFNCPPADYPVKKSIVSGPPALCLFNPPGRGEAQIAAKEARRVSLPFGGKFGLEMRIREEKPQDMEEARNIVGTFVLRTMLDRAAELMFPTDDYVGCSGFLAVTSLRFEEGGFLANAQDMREGQGWTEISISPRRIDLQPLRDRAIWRR